MAIGKPICSGVLNSATATHMGQIRDKFLSLRMRAVTAKLWTCGRCHCILHMGCTWEWARTAAAQALHTTRHHGSRTVLWACAICHEPQTSMPSKTTAQVCWCGRTQLDAVKTVLGKGLHMRQARERRPGDETATIPRSCLGRCSRALYPAEEEPGAPTTGAAAADSSERETRPDCGHKCQLTCHPV